MFIPEILPNSPIHPQQWFIGEPIHQEVSFPSEGKMVTADLYIPANDGEHPAVILFFGVVPAGPNDPRIVDLAHGLARSNMVVLIPWSDVMLTQRRLDPAAVSMLVEAFRYLEQHPSVDSTTIGLGGFCVGASFAALAAQDERIRDRVAYLNFFGGYYNAKDLLISIASQTRFYGSMTEPWQPRDDTREVFTAHLIEGLSDANEQELFRQLFLEDKLKRGTTVSSLSDDGEIVYRLLSGVTRPEAQALISFLPQVFLASLQEISPSRNIVHLKAPVLAMHDREDTAIPSTESQRMADALAGRNDVYHTEFSLFKHMDPSRTLPPPAMARELWKLATHMYHIMRLGT